MFKSLFSTRKASVTMNSQSILDRVFYGKITINELKTQDIYLSEQKKSLICQLIEISSEEYRDTEPKVIMYSLGYTLSAKKKREDSLQKYELSLKRNTLFFLYNGASLKIY